MHVSIILPCYNEVGNIGFLIDDLRRLCSPDRFVEIIVVDDNSPDETASFVEQKYAHDSNVRIIVRKQNHSLAKSVRAGIEAATGHIIIVMDSDYNHDPTYVPILCKIMECPDVDIAAGSRFVFGGASTSYFRYYLSRIYNIFISVLLSSDMSDNLSGFFAIRREKLLLLDFDKVFWGYGDYYFRLLLLTQRLNFYHIQIPIKYGHRRSGQSKTKFLQIFYRYTLEVFRVFYRKAIGEF